MAGSDGPIAIMHGRRPAFPWKLSKRSSLRKGAPSKGIFSGTRNATPRVMIRTNTLGMRSISNGHCRQRRSRVRGATDVFGHKSVSLGQTCNRLHPLIFADASKINDAWSRLQAELQDVLWQRDLEPRAAPPSLRVTPSASGSGRTPPVPDHQAG